LAEIFGLLSFLFAFVFSGTGKPPRPPSEPPQGPPRPPLPSTLPPPAQPPQVPPVEPPRATEPPGAPDEPPLDLASFHSLILHWLAVLRVPRDDRQDAAQEVVLSALRYWPSLVIWPGISEAIGRRRWLFAVTVHRASDYREHLRRGMARLMWPAIEGRIASEQPTAEELLLRRAEADEAAAVVDLEKLRAATSPERWTAFYAHDVEGLPMKAIAAAHGLPLGTVATHIRLAKEDLRAAIRRARAQRAGEEQRAAMRRKRGGG
jgi:DNA-directed RNA polymerase specialized sigma24 family protein